MAFEERLSLLLSKARDDYNEIVRTAHFWDGDIAGLAERITMTGQILTHMASSLSECYSDVEALLFYDRPLTAAYEQFKENGVSLWDGLMEPFDRFLLDTKQHIAEILEQWDELPMDEMARAEDYRTMEQQISNYYQENGAMLLERDRWQEKYHQNLERNFADCQEHLKHSKEIGGISNISFEAAITLLYNRMVEFDGFSNRQLQAMSQLNEPLTSVYECWTCFANQEIYRDILDCIILGTADAKAEFLDHVQQEQDNELER